MMGQLGTLSGASSTMSANTTVKQNEVSAEISQLDNSIKGLSEVVGRLADRLMPIMVAAVPTNSSSDKQISPQTDLGKAIREKSDRVEDVVAGLNNILHRLEI